MVQTRGGSPEELPRAGQAADDPRGLLGLHCVDPMEGWIRVPRVWKQGVLEIKAAPMDLRQVQIPGEGFGGYPVPRHQAPADFVVSDDVVVCWPKKWGKCACVDAKFWHW